MGFTTMAVEIRNRSAIRSKDPCLIALRKVRHSVKPNLQFCSSSSFCDLRAGEMSKAGKSRFHCQRMQLPNANRGKKNKCSRAVVVSSYD